MIQAYYTGTNGAKSSQNYMDVLSNNIANIQTDGYKKSNAQFSDLLYTNIKGTNNPQAGSGSRLEKITVVFEQGSLKPTGNSTDYAITGDGFFMVQYGDNRYLTRSGCFEKVTAEDEEYLMYQGAYVLDENEEPILLTGAEEEYSPGVFTVENNSLLIREGGNLFRLPEDTEYILSENPNIMRGYLESSGADLMNGVIELLEVQKSFQLNTKVIQTADEIEQTINSLRG